MRNYSTALFSFCFPPLAYPRSIQVCHMCSMIPGLKVVFCGITENARQDPTIAPQIIPDSINIIRVPFHRSRFLKVIDILSDKYDLTWSHVPDVYRSWVKKAFRWFNVWHSHNQQPIDLVITCGQPMSDHLLGLWYTRNSSEKWIAHFSDPWTDNPFRHDNPLTARLNKQLEAKVIQKADAIIFTAPESKDLVMKKYPKSWSKRAHILPHCYDKTRYDQSVKPSPDTYVIRSIGNFYGHRTPQPLFQAVETILNENSKVLNSVDIELIGSIEHKQKKILKKYPKANNKIKIIQSVSYRNSLQLMQKAHCLVVIDAPASSSVFFPSKLVDYLGAHRFILALTPVGPTSRIVREQGGMVVEPGDIGEIVRFLTKICLEKPSSLSISSERYEKAHVTQEMHAIINKVLKP